MVFVQLRLDFGQAAAVKNGNRLGTSLGSGISGQMLSLL
jgi:hypothetical protein